MPATVPTGSCSLLASRYREAHQAGLPARVLDHRQDQCTARELEPTKGQTAGKRVDVRREVAGRRGKAVTIVSGLVLDDAGVKELAAKLKQRCGVGGSVKHGVIELLGSHRAVLGEVRAAEGYRAVPAGV